MVIASFFPCDVTLAASRGIKTQWRRGTSTYRNDRNQVTIRLYYVGIGHKVLV